MARRPEITVISLINQEVVRTDFRKDFQSPVLQLTESLDADSNIGSSVDRLLSGKSKPAYKTIFVSSQIWSQVVSLPSSSVSGIPEEELEEALKFEAETLSGIEIEQIAIAYSPLSKQDEFQRYWVSAIERDDLDDIHSILVSYGCRDIFVAHPCGLSYQGKPQGNGQHWEFWDNLAYQINAQNGKLQSVRQADPAVVASGSVLHDSSLDDLDWSELPDSVTVKSLQSKEVFAAWVSYIASNYSVKKPDLNVPLIRFTKGTAGFPFRHVFSAIIAGVTVGLCIWHYLFLKSEIHKIVLEIEEVNRPGKEKILHDSEIKKVLVEREKLEEEALVVKQGLGQIEFFLDHQRDRIKELLTMIVDLRTDDLVIKEIGSSEEGVSISGFMVNGESAQKLATGLRERAGSLGWEVNPATLTGKEQLTTGGPWEFVIVLSDVGPFSSGDPARRKNPKVGKKSKVKLTSD